MNLIAPFKNSLVLLGALVALGSPLHAGPRR